MSKINTVSPSVRYLYYYNAFISFSLTVVSSFTFIDRLLLRMNIDLGLFGTIKSVIFLLPAIAYQIATPILQRVGNEVKVCLVSYILRGIFPSLLPFIAMMTDDTKILTIWCVILLPLGMVSAVFANNSLMQIYRKVIPMADYNYHVFTMNMLLSIPATLLALPIALILDRFENFSDNAFFLAFGLLQLFTIAFEIPAVYVMKKVKISKNKENKTENSSKKIQGSMLQPYIDQRFRLLLIITFLQRAINGLGSAYLTIYFLEIMQFSMTTLVIISMIMAALTNITLPSGGKIMDRFGYEKIILVLSSGMLAGIILFCGAWQSLWILPIFALLTWDGGGSLFASMIAQVEIAGSSKLADKSWLNAAVAAYSMSSNLGQFCGLLLASLLYTIANKMGNGTLNSTLHIFYVLNIPIYLMLFWSAVKFKKTAKGKHYIKL